MRLFWMAVGAAAMWWVMVKGRATMRKLTPEGVADQVEQRAARAAEQITDIYQTFRTAQREREAELREQMNM